MKAEILVSKAVFLCATAVVVLTACGGSASTTGTDEGSAPERSVAPEGDSGTGIPAPDFSFETFEGETFSSAEQRGTPIVLNFWESW